MDPDGISLYEAAKQAGYTPDCLERSIKKPGDVYASVEAHIEQNALLEREGLPLGVVTSICAPSNFVVEVTDHCWPCRGNVHGRQERCFYRSL